MPQRFVCGRRLTGGTHPGRKRAGTQAFLWSRPCPNTYDSKQRGSIFPLSFLSGRSLQRHGSAGAGRQQLAALVLHYAGRRRVRGRMRQRADFTSAASGGVRGRRMDRDQQSALLPRCARSAWPEPVWLASHVWRIKVKQGSCASIRIHGSALRPLPLPSQTPAFQTPAAAGPARPSAPVPTSARARRRRLRRAATRTPGSAPALVSQSQSRSLCLGPASHACVLKALAVSAQWPSTRRLLTTLAACYPAADVTRVVEPASTISYL